MALRALTAALLPLLLSAPAAGRDATGRKPHPPRSAVLPQAPVTSKDAFEEGFVLILPATRRAYLADEPMPGIDELDAYLANMLPPAQAAARKRYAALEEAIERAEYVQLGQPPGDSLEMYRLMIGHAADLLGVGALVEQGLAPELGRQAPPFAAACARDAAARGDQRRAFYLSCLGRRAAEEVYLKPARLQKTAHLPRPAELLPLREKILASLAGKPKISPALAGEIGRKMDADRRALSGERSGAALPPGWEGGDGRYSGAAVPGIGAPGARSAPLGARGLKTQEPPLHNADLKAGLSSARLAQKNQIGFTSKCYMWVKKNLVASNIVETFHYKAVRNAKGRVIKEVDREGKEIKASEQGHAYQFNDFVKNHPSLFKRKLRRVRRPHWPLPIGSIVVWSPGSGYNAESGHIEQITRLDPPQACSDGCGRFLVERMTSLLEVSEAAAQNAAALEQNVLALTAKLAAEPPDAAAVKGRLAKAKAALSAARARAKPLVNVYVIERPSKKAPPHPSGH